MNTVAIIPARAGSKGIKNKNIIDFCGKPLLAWSIEQATGSKTVDEVYVSTDGENIADVAEEYGASVIWRPDDISGDTATSESAIIHALGEIERKHSVDLVVLLQATSPLRENDDIDKAVEKFKTEGCDSLFSMAILEDYCLWKEQGQNLQSFTYDYKNRGRRQERVPLFLENGSIYVFKTDVLKRYNNRLGGKIGMYEMPFEHSFEIDSLKDIELCSIFMKKIIAEGKL